MFNKEEYYEMAHSGKIIDNTEILEYIKSFNKIILWGASYLGEAIGRYLIDNNVNTFHYWDMRSEDLKLINKKKVKLPFTDTATEDTLVIYCIGNNVIRGELIAKLRNKNYNFIRGDYLFEGAVCPFSLGSEIDSKVCQGSMCCRSIFCERLSNIVKDRYNVENHLHMFSITLVINQRCSLKCKHCTSYMNQYPVELRKDIPKERIFEDIDKFFDVMDSVGTVTIMGGEPFMHKDLSPIVKKLLEKNNFGIVSIATSGTYPMRKEQLVGLDDPRVNISFSNYEQSLSEKQIKIMHDNINLVKETGLSYTIGVTMPEWLVPSTLYDLDNSVEEMMNKKSLCKQPPRCMQLKNGKLHPCDFAQSLYCIGIADYEMDYVDVEGAELTELKEKIRNFIDQPYYRSCGHCEFKNGLTAKAAEQGYMDFTKPL